MNKLCTSIEQSKKLKELGIDINTADMYYSYDYNIDEYEDDAQIIPQNELGQHFSLFPEDIPAWSLSALLKLMPTDDKKDEYYLTTESHSDYHTVNYRNCWDGCIHSEYSEECLLDAAFEMVVWLKENNRL